MAALFYSLSWCLAWPGLRHYSDTLGYLHLQPGDDPLGLVEDLGVGEVVHGPAAHRPGAEPRQEVAQEGPLVPGLLPGPLGEEGVI